MHRLGSITHLLKGRQGLISFLLKHWRKHLKNIRHKERKRKIAWHLPILQNQLFFKLRFLMFSCWFGCPHYMEEKAGAPFQITPLRHAFSLRKKCRGMCAPASPSQLRSWCTPPSCFRHRGVCKWIQLMQSWCIVSAFTWCLCHWNTVQSGLNVRLRIIVVLSKLSRGWI